MRQESARLVRLMIKDPQKAALKPSTWKPRRTVSESQEVRLSIIALIMKVNSPRESMSRGNAKSLIKGRMKVFIRPNINPTNRIPHHSPV